MNKLDDLLNLAIDVVLCLGWVQKLNAGLVLAAIESNIREFLLNKVWHLLRCLANNLWLINRLDFAYVAIMLLNLLKVVL